VKLLETMVDPGNSYRRLATGGLNVGYQAKKVVISEHRSLLFHPMIRGVAEQTKVR